MKTSKTIPPDSHQDGKSAGIPDFEACLRQGEPSRVEKTRIVRTKHRRLHIARQSADDTVSDGVVSLIKGNSKITAAQMAEKLGVSIATVKGRLKSLKEKGRIIRIGADKNGYWLTP